MDDKKLRESEMFYLKHALERVQRASQRLQEAQQVAHDRLLVVLQDHGCDPAEWGVGCDKGMIVPSERQGE